MNAVVKESTVEQIARESLYQSGMAHALAAREAKDAERFYLLALADARLARNRFLIASRAVEKTKRDLDDAVAHVSGIIP